MEDALGMLLIAFGALGGGAAAVLWVRKTNMQSAAAQAAPGNTEAQWTTHPVGNSTAHSGELAATSASNAWIQAQDVGFAAELDAVAQADVYLAYGKDQAAEEILHEGLLQEPQSVAIYMKLAGIYAARQDTTRFALCADQVQALAGPQSVYWAQMQSLSQSMEPGNPHFQNTTGMGPSAVKSSAAPDLDPVLSFAPAGEDSATGGKVKLAKPMSIDLDSLALELAASPAAQTQSYSEQLETSMELAKQFIEIGELQGARSMLDEVIAKGSDAQRKYAQAMMAKLN